jgi:hypothetical protein
LTPDLFLARCLTQVNAVQRASREKDTLKKQLICSACGSAQIEGALTGRGKGCRSTCGFFEGVTAGQKTGAERMDETKRLARLGRAEAG